MIKEINGRWTCPECGYEWSGMLPDGDVPKICPVCMPKICGRCYDVVDKLVPAPCAEKPEKVEDAVGMYHCPDCGAMLLAGELHPELCQRCADRKHPGFDADLDAMDLAKADDKTKEQVLTNPNFTGFVGDKPSKMYLLLWDGLDIGHAVNTAAHAGAMIASKWPVEIYDGAGPVVWDPDMKEWYDLSFRKVTCKVTREEMGRAAEHGLEYFPVTESAYGGKEVALVFKPRKEWPLFFRSLKLYS